MKKYSLFLILVVVALLFFQSGDYTNAVSPSDHGLKEGDLISAIFSDDPDVYIINEHGYKRLFLNPEIFKFYSHLGGFANVKLVTQEVRDSFPTTGLFRNCEDNDPRVFGIDVEGEDIGQLHWVNTTGEQAVQDDPDFFKKVFCINKKEFSWYKKAADSFKSVIEVPKYDRIIETTKISTQERLEAKTELKQEGKVLVCHYPDQLTSKSIDIFIAPSAINTHLEHGDKIGSCSTPILVPSISLGPTASSSATLAPTPALTPLVTISPAPTSSASFLPTPTSTTTASSTSTASSSSSPTPTPSTTASISFSPTSTPTSISTTTPVTTVSPTPMASVSYSPPPPTTSRANVNFWSTPDGVKITDINSGTVYCLSTPCNNVSMPIETWMYMRFSKTGYNNKDFWVYYYTVQTFNTEVMLTAISTPTPTPTVTCVLNVSVSSSTPSDQSVNQGQSGVSLVKFDLIPNCSGTLKSFAVSLLPMPSGYQNVSSLRLYNDSTGAQLGSTMTVTGASVNFADVNTNLSANQTLTLKAVGDISSSAIAGSSVYGVFGGSWAVDTSNGNIGNNASGNIIAGRTTTITAIPTPTPTTGSVSFDNFSRDLYFGSKDNDVKQLQALLINEVNYPTNLITGYFGDITREAVKKLQEKYGVNPVSGYFGEITRKALTALISN